MKFSIGPAHRSMILVTVLLAMPFLIAWGLYAFGWRPEKSGNYGELIQPPPQLPMSQLVKLDKQPIKRDDLLGKWQFVMVSSGPCREACRHTLHQMRQVHVSLNKEMSRLKRLWISTEAASDPAAAELQATYPDLQIAIPPKDGAWDTALPSADRAYLIDPLGNIILRYPADPDWNKVRRDVERLLKYSWTG